MRSTRPARTRFVPSRMRPDLIARATWSGQAPRGAFSQVVLEVFDDRHQSEVRLAG